MVIMSDNNLAINLELYTYICTLKKEVDIESHIVDIFGHELDRLYSSTENQLTGLCGIGFLGKTGSRLSSLVGGKSEFDLFSVGIVRTTF